MPAENHETERNCAVNQFLTTERKAGTNMATDRMWNADLGNGKYRNPILYADYSKLLQCAGASAAPLKRPCELERGQLHY